MPLLLAARPRTVSDWSIGLGVWPLHALLAAPAYLYLGTLTIMLFRPPDVDLYHLDRIAFAVLVFAVVLRSLWRHDTLFRHWTLTLPMLALTLLAGCSAAGQSFDPQTWSLLSAEFIVPFTVFHLAGSVFRTPESRRKFEFFSVCVLAYLTFQAIAFLLGWNALVFPRYILDDSLGIHIDRARGPFLQAVANGVSLLVFGLITLDCYRRRVLSRAGLIALALLPVAVFATMTRAVWIATAASALVLLFRVKTPHVRRAGLLFLVTCVLGALFVLSIRSLRDSSMDRVTESGPVEIREAIYQASWDMIRERPLLGWGQNQMPAEVVRRMPEYDLDAYWAHNTYLEMLVEHGILGLVLYAWIIVALFRLGRHSPSATFTVVWPIILGVYVFNSFFVVMNYQFVNALVYTIAGIVASDTSPESVERYR